MLESDWDDGSLELAVLKWSGSSKHRTLLEGTRYLSRIGIPEEMHLKVLQSVGRNKELKHICRPYRFSSTSSLTAKSQTAESLAWLSRRSDGHFIRRHSPTSLHMLPYIRVIFLDNPPLWRVESTGSEDRSTAFKSSSFTLVQQPYA